MKTDVEDEEKENDHSVSGTNRQFNQVLATFGFFFSGVASTDSLCFDCVALLHFRGVQILEPI